MKKTIHLVLLIIFLTFTIQIGRSFRVNQIPNGPENTCSNCHVNPAGGGTRNDFGQTVEGSFLDNNGNVMWGPDLAAIDSDGDGFTNGEELQDPDGSWVTGTDHPGDPSLVTLPGDPNSHPDPSPVRDGNAAPTKFALENNYPNPFNPSTTIKFTIPEANNVRLVIFDALGQSIATLEDKFLAPGTYTYIWNATNGNGKQLNSGIYFYTLESGDFSETKRMLYLK